MPINFGFSTKPASGKESRPTCNKGNEDIQVVIKKLKSKNIGVLITDHNVHETLSVTDRSYLLYDGKILKSGTSKDLSNDDVAKRLYLGKNFELRN